MKSVSHLPDPDNSVSDEDKKNNNGLNKGGGCLLSLFKQSQHLNEHRVHMILADILYCNSLTPVGSSIHLQWKLALEHVWEQKCLNVGAGKCGERKKKKADTKLKWYLVRGAVSVCCL